MMKYIIRHDGKTRIRIHILHYRPISSAEADYLVHYFSNSNGIEKVSFHDRTDNLSINYHCSRKKLLDMLEQFNYREKNLTDTPPQNSLRTINQHYQDMVSKRIVKRIVSRLFFPAAVRTGITVFKSIKYFIRAISDLKQKGLNTTLLDAVILATSYIRSDYESAAIVVFLLDLGEILSDWIEKNKIESLSETMSFNIDYVRLYDENEKIMISPEKIHKGDVLLVREGEIIPFDGNIVSGAGSIIQSSLTGNALPRAVTPGEFIYAGTVLEEGVLTLSVQEELHTSRYDHIISMVDQMQDLKPPFEHHAMTVANKLVPYLLGGSAFTWLISRNTDQACSCFMVDFSYALKLILPLSVLHTRKKLFNQNIIIKGGKFMEAMAKADIIVFDKTGTLTKASPVLKHIESYGVFKETDLLRIAAGMEEHFSNITSNAIVEAARSQGLPFNETHSDIKQIWAHGISTYICNDHVIMGSYHFVFEDQQCPVPNALLKNMSSAQHAKEHHLYLAINNQLEGVFCVEDVLRDEVSQVIRDLREQGFEHCYMLTGDTELSAMEAADEAGIGHYFADKLPEEKADFIRSLQKEGHTVVMVGDGVNDSPAMTVADVGIAMSQGASVTKQLADVVIDNNNLFALIKLRQLCRQLMEKMKTDYHFITRTNAALICLGASGIITPSALSLYSNLITLLMAIDNL